MDTNKLEKSKNQLTQKFSERVRTLQQQIDNLTLEFNAQVKQRQDEIDSLTLQTESLTTFDVSTSKLATVEAVDVTNTKI